MVGAMWELVSHKPIWIDIVQEVAAADGRALLEDADGEIEVIAGDFYEDGGFIGSQVRPPLDYAIG
jgi:hypothetical protein